MARLGLAGSSGNSSGTTAIRVPRTFEEQIEEAHGLGDPALAEAMAEGSNSPVNALAATVVADERSDVRNASQSPPQQTVIEERLMRMNQGGLGGVEKSYRNPFDAPRGFQDGGTAEERELLEQIYDPLGGVEVGVGEEGSLGREASELAWDIWRPDAVDVGLGGLALTGAGAALAGPGYLANRIRKAAGKVPEIYRLGKRALGRGADFVTPRGMGGRGLNTGPRLPWTQRAGARGPDGRRISEDARMEVLGGRAARGIGGGAIGYGLGSALLGGGEDTAPADMPDMPITAPAPPGPTAPPGGGGTGDGPGREERFRHEYQDYLRDIFGDAKDEGPSGESLMMLQLASNLLDPDATAFQGMPELGMGQKELKQRRNANNARIALGMAGITSDTMMMPGMNAVRRAQAMSLGSQAGLYGTQGSMSKFELSEAIGKKAEVLALRRMGYADQVDGLGEVLKSPSKRREYYEIHLPDARRSVEASLNQGIG